MKKIKEQGHDKTIKRTQHTENRKRQINKYVITQTPNIKYNVHHTQHRSKGTHENITTTIQHKRNPHSQHMNTNATQEMNKRKTN